MSRRHSIDESLERQNLFPESPEEFKISNFFSKLLPQRQYSSPQKEGKEHSILWLVIAAIIIGLLIGDLIVRLVPWGHAYVEADDYNNPPIILLGDSITEYGYATDRGGWTSLMSCAYALRYDVLNR
jgi:hypothetical protein